MAEAILNHEARAKGLPIVAKSAGTVGGKAVNPQAMEALAEIGVPTEGLVPKFITPELVAEAEHVISMGCGVDAEACPTRFMLTEDWGLDDPSGQPIETVRTIRDQIRGHVREFLARIESTESNPA